MSFVPRGGGGGGFRGGGGGGGGFRGGGFRGGSRSFRVGNVRSSGRPFGRTGSRRTVSRAPRSRNYHRPHHRRHWGGYYRPWWRRPWHWYWWWGRPYRPWYYAPVYWGGGTVLLIVALLVIIPVMGFMVIPYPFSSADAQGTITYRDTQTLWYNEYWYEKEPMSAGQSIDYNIQSLSEVTFLIWNQPFEDFPDTKTLTGSYQESLTVEADHDYEYIGYFLKKDSQLTYDFNITSGGPIEFFIADANDLTRWNNWETIYTTVSYTGSVGDNGSFEVPHSQDWYLVWYNSGTSPVQLDFIVDYTAVGAFDFSNADVVEEGVDNVATSTFVVPSTGDWYFFIYFDPFGNSAESVDITFDVSYNTNVSSNDRWTDLTPIFVIIGIILVILLIVAVIQRRSAKKTPATATTVTTATTPTTTETGQPETEKKCHRCNFPLQPGDIFCNNCGAKLSGRDYGVSKITTPATEKNCRSCGKLLIPNTRFCKHCGAKIEQKVKTHKYFPDERDAFFCQLDNEKHPSTDSAYECDQCSRMVCSDCYDNITQTGVSRCPYCKGELSKVQ